MAEAITTQQMRALERAAIESGEVSGRVLMERAAMGVVRAASRHWPVLGPGSAVAVLCGPGNNGGDGFAIARLLAERGMRVRVLAARGASDLPPDAAHNAARWARIGPLEPLTLDAFAAGPPPDLIVDAVFGAGLTRPPAGEVGRLLSHLAGLDARGHPYRPRIVAVDAPSALNLDTGRVLLDPAPRAAVTVSFHRLKLGHLLAQGPAVCGALEVADIGLTHPPGLGIGLVAPLHGAGPASGYSADTGGFDPARLGKAGEAGECGRHKFDHGHALVLSGAMGRSGAARLAARAALRIGAGLVTLGAPGAAMLEIAAQITALMLRRIDGPEDLAQVLADRRITALCLGPGLGLERAEALLPVALAADRPCVLDADALSALARNWRPPGARCVLTPHGGEFARLFPDLADRLKEDAGFSKLDAARAAAARAGAVVVFKGADTVIAAPDGRCALHAAVGPRAAPWLATAGSGDVLAGLVCGLMARGFDPFDAARMAVWLHVEAARQVGPGLIAEDLPEALPAVLAALLGGNAAPSR